MRKGDASVLARLDRYISNTAWISCFPRAEAENLGYWGSDHRHVLLILQPIVSHQMRRIQKRFLFEHKWFMEADFTDYFSQKWQECRCDTTLPNCLSICSGALKSWAGNRVVQMGRQIKALRKDLDRLMGSNVINNNHFRIQEVQKKIEKLIDQEEVHWNQRARVNWLQNGDRNTKFFHTTASQRKRTNCIKCLLSDNGEWCTSIQDLANISKDYFEKLYASNQPSTFDIEAVTSCTEKVVNARMNEFFVLLFLVKRFGRQCLIYIPLRNQVLMGLLLCSIRNYGQS
ncbi:uncharacterized protein [Primulina eburnea]|uniref:uncharacterized protein n=1 Tax=Primulina eburnea TaxID=1245227 RepID=UPI003C6C643F